MDQENDNLSHSYIYTNWRGKSFIIDERFAEDLRNSLIEDGSSPEDVASITPESLMEELPDMERWDRYFQLEEMWEKSAS